MSRSGLSTSTLGTMSALDFPLPPKRESRATKGSAFATAIGFIAIGCFMGAMGVAAGFVCLWRLLCCLGHWDDRLGHEGGVGTTLSFGFCDQGAEGL